MAVFRLSGPYVWVTWLSKLLVGESSCEWGSWFKAQHHGSSWDKIPSDFDQVQWLLKHTELLQQTRGYCERQGYQVSVDSQNFFTLRGRSATLAGRPDLVATRDNETVVVDVKAGQPSSASTAQVMAYMYSLPRALRDRYGDASLSGQVVYPDGPVEVPPEAVNDEFVRSLGRLMRRRVGSPAGPSAASAPSAQGTVPTGWRPTPSSRCGSPPTSSPHGKLNLLTVAPCASG